MVEGVRVLGKDQRSIALDLACIDDDAQGERLSAVVGAEIDFRRVEDDLWARIAREGTDDPEVFSAHLRAVTWRSATAADRELFQAPFRAGIRLDPYQLLPLSKALKLPRVNLLIADDVGLGKTIEAGLVLRELLLRRRVDYVIVSAPAAMTAQWQDELAQKFGLSFTIVDREYLAAVRRSAGFAANPWEVGSRFIISHSLLADETYRQGLLERLGDMRPRSMLILDEAHNAAPASGQAYAVDSNLTKAVRGLAGRFEHRLFQLKDEQMRFLDAGEQMLWAHALTRTDTWVLCGPDKASLRVGIRLGHRDRLVSLERLLKDAGFNLKNLREAYTQRWLEQALSQLALLERRNP
jgi:hypothetical protein